jgi:hypothetical protein
VPVAGPQGSGGGRATRPCGLAYGLAGCTSPCVAAVPDPPTRDVTGRESRHRRHHPPSSPLRGPGRSSRPPRRRHDTSDRIRHSVRVDENSIRAVFIFDGGDLAVHDSLAAAAGWLEAIDVENRESDFYGDDGTVIAASAEGQVVRLAPTNDRRPEELRARLDQFLTVIDSPAEIRSSSDVLTVGQYLIDRQWASQWPRRPRWLARRLNGDGPPRIRRA